MAALDQESSVITEASPVIPSGKARRRLKFAGAGPATDVSAVEPAGAIVAGTGGVAGHDVSSLATSVTALIADDVLSGDVSGDLNEEDDEPAPMRIVRQNAVGKKKVVKKKNAPKKKKVTE